MPRMTPISFGGSGPERAKVKKTATMTAAAAKMTRPEWARPPIGGLVRVAGAVPVLLRGGEQEDGVVHRDREDHREEEDGRPGVEEALRLEAEQAGAVAVLEDQAADAEGGADGEQVREHAERGDQRRLQGDEQEQEAEREHDADHERRLRRERLLEVVVLGGGAADERAGREARRGAGRSCGRRLLLDGSAFGIAWTSARPLRARLRLARRGRCRGRGAAIAATAAASPRGATIWSAPGAPTPNACCTCV